MDADNSLTKVTLRHSGLAGRPKRYTDYQQGWTLIPFGKQQESVEGQEPVELTIFGSHERLQERVAKSYGVVWGCRRKAMKAAVYVTYGPPDVIRITDAEKPIPKDGEVLIKVSAASVNPYDWHFMRGEPYPLRLAVGLRKPKDRRLGTDVAGEVEAIGKGVARVRAGDAVFGTCKGAFAEYACTSESKLAKKPENVTFEEAAAAPIAGLTALQSLRDKGGVQAGQRVLINGAAGGVGTFAVQIAKACGAEVTGVCSARNVEMVRSLGADQAIDYTRQNFTEGQQRYDLILDCIANHSLSGLRRVLEARGIYVVIGGKSGPWMMDLAGRLIQTRLASLFSQQKLLFAGAKVVKEDLVVLGEMMGQGKIKVVIDRRYGLKELPEAIRYSEEGHARGKLVVIP